MSGPEMTPGHLPLVVSFWMPQSIVFPQKMRHYESWLASGPSLRELQACNLEMLSMLLTLSPAMYIAELPSS